MRHFRKPYQLLLLLSIALLSAACHSDRRTRVIVVDTGIVVADFQSIADYVADPTVQEILRFMPRNGGSSPPTIQGQYFADGTIDSTTIPGTAPGDAVTAEFCVGANGGSLIDVTVLDLSVQEGGALSFIEGSGNQFTIYTAFKSVQTLATGGTCEIHEVNIYSGTVEADGSLSDLYIGQGIVGIIGTCSTLLVGDFQISHTSATRTADSCLDGSDPGSSPADPGLVLAEIENNLVVDVLVFVNGEDLATAVIPALSVGSFETEPGFVLDFESVQPIAGQDSDGNDVLMGEIIGGVFPQDPAVAGGSSLYLLENVIGDDTFFAPLPLNESNLEIFSVVNSGVFIPFYPDPQTAGLDCLCALPPDPEPFLVGYYSYSLPGIIEPSQANVAFFNVADESQLIDQFHGPFPLEDFTGAVVLRVE